MPRLLLICAVLTCLLACLPNASAEPVTITGTVVGPDEQPLPEARVWLLRTTYDYPQDTRIVQSTKTDAHGEYRFEPVDTGPITPRTTLSFEVLALKPGLAVGRRRVPSPGLGGSWEADPLLFARAPGQVIVQCTEAAPLSAKAVAADGSAVVATVSYPIGLRGDTPDELQARCAADGSFTIPWLPADHVELLTVEAPGLGRAYVRSDELPETPTVTLRPLGRLELHFTCPERPELLTTIRGDYRGEMDNLVTSGTFQADAQGMVELPDLQPGTYEVTLGHAGAAPWQAPSRDEVYVTSGATRRVEIPLERGVAVAGRVVVTDTGQPVAGARVLTNDSQPGLGGPAVTDAQGSFTLYALPGRCDVFVDELPRGYVAAEPPMATAMVDETGVTLEPFRAVRSVTVDGLAVDEKGRPVADASIYYSQTYHRQEPLHTDAAGKFTLKCSVSRESYVWASKRDLAAPETTFNPERLAGPLRVVLAPTPRVRLRVRVVDQDGLRVPRAFISPLWQGRSAGGALLPGLTDQQGEWISEPQIGFGSYQLYIGARGHDAARSERWQARAGETHDFGDVRLLAAGGSLAGTVVDQENRPVAGVRVFNTAEALRPAAATTGPDGRFALSGLLPGRAFVFADSPGHLFTGACAQVGSTDVVVRLSPRPEVKALTVPTPPAITHAAEVEAARQLVTQALDRADPYQTYAQDLVCLLAAMDLPAARQRSAAVQGYYDDEIAVGRARTLVADDPEAALQCLASIKDENRRRRAQARAIIALAGPHPDIARREFAQVLPLAEAIEPPAEAAQYLAAMALAIFPADRALAERAARKAQEVVNARVARHRDGAETRWRVAEAVALFDADAALEIVRGMPEYTNGVEHGEAWVAAGCARVDPARAEAVMAAMPFTHRYDDILRVLCPMLKTDYERAVRLAQDAGFARPRVLAWLSLFMRDTNADEAWWLYQQALGALEYVTAERSSWLSSMTGRDAAMVAAIGRQIGYPCASELAWRAISLRPAPTSGSHDAWSDRELMILLAMAQPDVAKNASLVAAERLRPTDEHWELGERVAGLTTALALSDPSGAPAGIRSLSAKTGCDPTFSPDWWRMVRMLMSRPDERLMACGRMWEGMGPAGEDLPW